MVGNHGDWLGMGGMVGNVRKWVKTIGNVGEWVGMVGNGGEW